MVKNMMGFLFEYTPGKVTWKIKHHPIEKENDLESQTKKQTPFWGVQNMIFPGKKASLQFRAVRFSVGSHLGLLSWWADILSYHGFLR